MTLPIAFVKKIVLFIWLSLMFVIPKEYGLIKGLLLIFICGGSLIHIIKLGYINAKEFLYFLGFIGYFLLSIFIGIISGWKFDITQDYPLFFYYILTPICVFLFGYLYQENKIYIIKLCVIITFVITILDLIRIFMILGMIPHIPLIDFIVRVDSENTLANELTLRISNESSLIFLVPLNILLIGTFKKNMQMRMYNFFIIGASIFGTIYAMLSGRRILEIGILLSWAIVGFVFFRQRFTMKTLVKGSAFLIVFIIAITYILSTISTSTNLSNLPDMIINTFFEGFTGAGMQNRQNYTPGLIDLWIKSPIWGNGLNAYGDVLANRETFWSYEVVFLALLGQAGIMGVAIIFFGVIMVLKNYYNIYHNTDDLIIKKYTRRLEYLQLFLFWQDLVILKYIMSGFGEYFLLFLKERKSNV